MCPAPVSYTHLDVYKRQGMHRSDTMQEKLSLVARFGVTIYYGKPSQKEYFTIVKELRKRYPSITLTDEEDVYKRQGISCIAASKDNLDWVKKSMTVQIISHDKINQLRHVRFFKDLNGIKAVSYTHLDVYKRQGIYQW